MKSYREKFQTKLDEEISAFREGVLALSGQEIYDNAYKIYFYEFMYNYLYSEKFTAVECQAFLATENTFIRQLWLQSLRCEGFNVGNIADTSSLVDFYMRDHAEYSVPKRMQFMNDDELVNSVWDNINKPDVVLCQTHCADEAENRRVGERRRRPQLQTLHDVP